MSVPPHLLAWEMAEWWEWDLRFGAHAVERMEERGLSEVELRAMLDDATEISPAHRRGRWLIETRWAGQPWSVVVEPNPAEQITEVVTVFRREDNR